MQPTPSASRWRRDALPGDEAGAERGEREGGRRRGRGRNRRDGREGRRRRANVAEARGRGGERAFAAAADATRQRSAAAAAAAGESKPRADRGRCRSPPVAGRSAVAPAVAAREPAARRRRPQPFALPIDDLRALAASAGLEWVNSDAERILVVQQAMANEPKPVHVPRAPRPRVVIDDGPLVLVETRKDLSQLKLPFEQQQQPPAA